MEMIKQYIKQILKEEYKLDDVEFNKETFDILFDKALEEEGEPVLYKNVSLKVHQDAGIYGYVHFVKEPTIPVQPKYSKAVLTGRFIKTFKKRLYRMMEEHLNILKFEDLFLNEMKERGFTRVGRNGFYKIVETAKRKYELKVVFIEVGEDDESIGFWKRGLIKSAIGIRNDIDDKGYFISDPDYLMVMVKEHLESMMDYEND